jgi:hypothetical protein
LSAGPYRRPWQCHRQRRTGAVRGLALLVSWNVQRRGCKSPGEVRATSLSGRYTLGAWIAAGGAGATMDAVRLVLGDQAHPGGHAARPRAASRPTGQNSGLASPRCGCSRFRPWVGAGRECHPPDGPLPLVGESRLGDAAGQERSLVEVLREWTDRLLPGRLLLCCAPLAAQARAVCQPGLGRKWCPSLFPQCWLRLAARAGG